MADRVLITGVTGFIAKQVARAALEAGYAVRGTLRDRAKGEALTATLKKAGAETGRLELVEADLTADAGWAEVAEGCRYVLHVASPFPMQQPRDREALVPAARAGSLRVLDAALAAGAERIVLTSSIVAMMYKPDRPAVYRFGEEAWSDPEWPALTSYIVSKTRAEQAAWARMREAGAEDRLTVINPGFVLGPALDATIGTSLGAIQLILRGKYPALPPTAYPVVDVRDLAELHVRAATAEGAGGRRLLAAADTLSLPEMSAILRARFGEKARKAPRLTLPRFAVRLAAMADPALRSTVPDLDCRALAESGYVTELTGVAFRPGKEAVEAAGQSLFDHGLV